MRCTFGKTGDVNISKFDNIRDNLPKSQLISWSEFVGRYNKHLIVSDKEAAPLISPAEWSVGAERKKEGVLRVHFAALDLDGVSEDVVRRLREIVEPYRFLLCTTWSHPKAFEENGLWYFRIFMPLSRPVEAAEWPAFWSRLNTFFENTLDGHCSDPGRIYYVPSAPKQSACNQVIEQDGIELNVEQILKMAVVENKKPFEVSREAVKGLAKSLKARSNPHYQQLGETLSKVLKGEVFAVQGERDSILFKLSSVLAEKWPKAEASSLAEYFKASLYKMHQLSGDAPTLDDVIKKIVRHQDRVVSEQAEANETSSEILRRRIRNAFGGKRDVPYTEEELAQFAKDCGVSREDFCNRWIIQQGQSFYVFKNGRYKKPVGFRELLNTAYKDLAPAVSAGVSLSRVTPKGAVIKKTVDEIVQEYGTAVESGKANFTLQKSRYDWETETFEEAVCPLRNLKPEFSKTVDDYFKVLGGAYYEKLNDWVSVVTQLDKPCSALFLHGVPGSGKTLLACGLTRLWSQGEPTELAQVLGGSFNEALTNCPLVLADEQLPSFIKKEGSTAELRSFIQARTRTLTRKFRTPITLQGAIRLIITANNRNLFHTGEALTNNDIEAIRGRILYLDVGQASKDYLNSLNVVEKEGFVLNDGIAKHALWLRDHHEIREKDDRYLVAGVNSIFHDSLMSGTGIRRDVCCWLVSYLQNPGKMANDSEKLIRVSEGSLWVHPRALVSYWRMYETNIQPPAASAISSALSGLSSGRKQLKDGLGKLTYYRKIDANLLLAWNQDSGYTTNEELVGALNQGELV